MNKTVNCLTLKEGLRDQLFKIPTDEWIQERIHQVIMEFMKSHVIVGISERGYLVNKKDLEWCRFHREEDDCDALYREYKKDNL